MAPPNNPNLDWQSRILATIAWWMKPKVYVELGLAKCETIGAVAPYAEELYGIDIAKGVIDKAKSIPRCKAYHAKTSEFAIIWDNEIKKNIDLIFIDADHKCEAALGDTLGFYKWLTPDIGLMALHDTWPPDKKFTKPHYSYDSYRVPAILKRKLPDAEVLTIPTHFGLTLVRKVGSDWRNA